MQQGITNTIEHLFRNEYGKLVAILTNKFGTTYLEVIEDAVQDTFIKAMRIWGYQNIPDHPTAWLVRVANNAIIDQLRRTRKNQYFSDAIIREGMAYDDEIATSREITDSQLKMIFACCDPVLSAEQQIILSLKFIGGFSNKELAEALLKKEEAVAKAFTRAKKKFKEQVQIVKTPVEMGLQSRLFVVLHVIYLLFSEGYATTSGSQILKKDICYEAMRLALLLRENKYCQHANLEALIALMCFHAARFDARMDDKGSLVDLKHQDRSKYSQELIQIGLNHLEQADTTTKFPSNYHLEAAVSYYHSSAKSFEATDWESILKCYDLLLRNQYSPMVALNRILPYGKVHGAQKALVSLQQLEKTSDFSSNALFYAIKAELEHEVGTVTFKKTLEQAIQLSTNELVKAHLKRKLLR